VYESYADSLPYRCFPDDPNRVRKPDASAILLNRIREAELSDDFRICTIAPDLAVEVVSPTDNARRLDAKVQEYLAAGVPRVWVVWPEAHALTEYGPDHHHRRYAADEEVTLPHLHPEYRARVGSFFD
jgi:Uma2 family endonuclease